ncbi:MAG: hypothetical protein JRI25_19740 [Deltaproteobacteria bacterium]|nr:hypothetical protein [Deltaproteobacteria bacterium]
MPNPYIPRIDVHAWSEAIGNNQADHEPALTRLLKQQRRLTRFLEENRESLAPASAGIAVYLYGVLARIYDLAGGQLRTATWAQVRDAERRVGAEVANLLPLDDGFAERVREVAWRVQPHVLDEALMALFDREDPEEGEANLDDGESAKVFLLMWVANEVLDANWRPGTGFAGETTYTYVHIEEEEKEAADQPDG